MSNIERDPTEEVKVAIKMIDHYSIRKSSSGHTITFVDDT